MTEYDENARYIAYAEDEPFTATEVFADIGLACQWLYDRVMFMLQSNGCGDGLVVDRLENSIVTILGGGEGCNPNGDSVIVVGPVPTPDREEQAAMVEVAKRSVEWLNGGPAFADGEYPWIWKTTSD